MSNEWTPERRARAALTFICEAGSRALAEMVATEGAEAVVQSLRTSQSVSAWTTRARALKIDELLALAAEHGIRFIMPGDDEWPDVLSDLETSAPVAGMGGVPHGLWLKGPGHLARWAERAVAIVGARSCTNYGDQVASNLAAELADPEQTLTTPWFVISGGAYGIDAAAHRGALSTHGRTIGIYAGGLDECYPKGNARLFDALCAEQLVVSELPPGLRPTRPGFLARNRLIATLSQGTVVVEAADRSGARNTAHWAAELGRPVMAVPGSVMSAMSITPHRLIRDGEAVLVANPDDVRAVVEPMGSSPWLPSGGAQRPLDVLTPNQTAAREALPGRGARSLGDVAMLSGLSVPQAAAALGELELMGLVKGTATGWWQLVWPADEGC